METVVPDPWKLPRKPRVLLAGIALAIFNIIAVLMFASVVTTSAPLQYFALATQMIAALILRGIVVGTPGMRWVYIAYDALQLAGTILINRNMANSDVIFAALSLAVWTCLTLPDAHAWFRRVPRHQLGLCRHDVLKIPEEISARARNGALLGLGCALFFVYHAPVFDKHGWLWPFYLAPLAVCVALEWRWARRLNKRRVR